VPVAKGHPGNPMSWDDMHGKFDALVAPRLGSRTDSLFGLLREFGLAAGWVDYKVCAIDETWSGLTFCYHVVTRRAGDNVCKINTLLLLSDIIIISGYNAREIE